MPEKKLEVWQEDFFKDIPYMGPIDKKFTRNVLKNIFKFSGSVRVSMGLIWTNKEWEKFRKRVLSKPLP